MYLVGVGVAKPGRSNFPWRALEAGLICVPSASNTAASDTASLLLLLALSYPTPFITTAASTLQHRHHGMMRLAALLIMGLGRPACGDQQGSDPTDSLRKLVQTYVDQQTPLPSDYNSQTSHISLLSSTS